MALDEDQVRVMIQVALDEFKTQMSAATTAMKSSVDEMNQHLSAMGTVVEGVMGKFEKFAEVAGLGELLKKSVEETVAFTDASLQLANRLGTTTEAASQLSIMFGDVYTTTTAYLESTRQLDRQVRSNEDNLNRMGLATRDANGQLLNQQDLFKNAIETLKEYKEGTDRNLAAQVFLGRGAGDLTSFMRLEADSFAEAEEKANRLGLTVGGTTLQAVEDFKKAHNDLKDVLDAVYRAIADALMPALTDLMNNLSEMGEASLPVLRQGLAGVAVAFYGIKEVIDVVWAGFKFAIQGIVTTLATLSDALIKFASGDFTAATNALKTGFTQWMDSFDNMLDSIVTKSEQNKERIEQALGISPKPAAAEKPGSAPGSKSFVDPAQLDKEGKDFLKAAQAVYEELQRNQGVFQTVSGNEAADYWNSLTGYAQKYGIEVQNELNKRIYQFQRQAGQETVDAAKHDLDLQLEDNRVNLSARVELLDNWLNTIKTLYGQDSKQYREAEMQKLAAARAVADELVAIARDNAKTIQDATVSMIDGDKSLIAMRKQLGEINDAEELAALETLEQRKYQIKLQYLEQELDDVNLTEEQKNSIRNQMYQLDVDRQIAHTNFVRQEAVAQLQMTNEVLTTATNSINSSINQYMTTGLTFRQFELNLAQSLVQYWLKAGLDMVKNWTLKELVMSRATTAGEELRTATVEGAAATTETVKVAQATTEITANAASGASGVFSALASIPYIGPFIAPAAAIAAFAAIIAYVGKISSAEGGWWQVPGDTMANIHKDEMVLPAWAAKPLRDNIESGTVSGGGDTHLHVHATDAASVERLFRNNASALKNTLKQLKRDGALAGV